MDRDFDSHPSFRVGSVGPDSVHGTTRAVFSGNYASRVLSETLKAELSRLSALDTSNLPQPAAQNRSLPKESETAPVAVRPETVYLQRMAS